MALKENNVVKTSGSTRGFADMMTDGFGIVTVMNAKVYDVMDDISSTDPTKAKTPNDIIAAYEDKDGEAKDKYICEIKTLKVANVTQEGPNKTVSGGQYSNPLIKFGKSARLEMQDALGTADVIEALGGGTIGYAEDGSTINAIHFSEQFAGPKTIIGDSFFIDQKSGKQVKVKIIFYQFLPDSIFNLTQDAEGDATVFDLNGDLLTTDVKLTDKDGKNFTLGLFYSIVNPEEATA